jgi:hypothetical protein
VRAARRPRRHLGGVGGLHRFHRPRRSRHRARRLHTCPRPTGGAGLPAREGGLSQPAPATNTTS